MQNLKKIDKVTQSCKLVLQFYLYVFKSYLLSW